MTSGNAHQFDTRHTIDRHWQVKPIHMHVPERRVLAPNQELSALLSENSHRTKALVAETLPHARVRAEGPATQSGPIDIDRRKCVFDLRCVAPRQDRSALTSGNAHKFSTQNTTYRPWRANPSHMHVPERRAMAPNQDISALPCGNAH